MKNTFSILVVGGLLLSSMVACGNSGDQGTAQSVSNALIPTASASEHDDEDDWDRDRNSNQSADSSPFVVGVWKFVNPGPTPTVDTEFRFINPTSESLTLEYAFFEADGTFCGCDRDDFPPNKTTEYTMLDEQNLPPPLPNGPKVFSCTGNSGALKSIVFRTSKSGKKIRLNDAMQIGFQTHAFGGITEGGSAPFLTGNVMTEAPLQGIGLNRSTREEIRKIHEQCVTVNGPL